MVGGQSIATGVAVRRYIPEILSRMVDTTHSITLRLQLSGSNMVDKIGVTDRKLSRSPVGIKSGGRISQTM